MVVNMEVYKLVDEVADMVVVVISVGQSTWAPKGCERRGEEVRRAFNSKSGHGTSGGILD